MSTPGRLIAMPSAIVATDSISARAPAAQRLHVWRALLRLDTDQLHVHTRAAQRDADAAAETAAADGHHHAREIRHVLEQLQPERALPGDHIDVVEGVHERCAAAFRARRAPSCHSLLNRSALQLHVRAKPLAQRRPSRRRRRAA